MTDDLTPDETPEPVDPAPPPRTARRRAGATTTGHQDAARPRPADVDKSLDEQPDEVTPAPSHVDTETAPKPPRSRWTFVAGVLTALVVILAVANLVLYVLRPDSDKVERDRLLAAVKKIVPLITSYDYRHLPQDRDAAKAHLSGQFKDEYVKSLDTVIGPLATQAQAVKVGSVSDAGITSFSRDGHSATVVIFGQTNLTTKAAKNPDIQIMNLIVMVEKHGDDWYVTKADQPR